MKKAKIMVTALAVLAVVGGALAFKANKVGGNLFCSTTTFCPGPTKYITDPKGQPLFCTEVAGACPNISTVIEFLK